jgi:lactate dehydrogenase-like 2-hydroxyacid dehydrogenase
MKKKILVTRRLLIENEEKLKELFDVKLNSKDELYTSDKIIELSKDCDGILSAITDQFNKDLIEKLPPSIKIIANFAVGFGNIDVNAAVKKNIIVTNTPEVLDDSTADISILLLLGASRKVLEARRVAELQNWKWSADFISTGNIGCMSQISSGTNIPIVHTVEIIDWLTGGPKPNKLKSL